MNAHQYMDFSLPDPNEMNTHSDWEIDFRQIEPGASVDSRVFVRSAGPVSLLMINLPNAVHQQGCAPSDTLTLGMPLSGLRYWNGREIDSPYLLGFGEGQEFDSVSGEAFSGLTISIDMSFVHTLCEKLGQPFPEDFLRQMPMRRISSDLGKVRDQVLLSLAQPDWPFGAAEQEDVVAGLIKATVVAEGMEDRSTLPDRAKCMRRALEFIEHQADENPLISEICAYANVSWRTLDRSFKERFGIGPKAYLNRYRLVRFRSSLLKMRDGESISSNAHAWGFWHMGQLARDYHNMFGELPSETSKSAGKQRTIFG